MGVLTANRFFSAYNSGQSAFPFSGPPLTLALAAGAIVAVALISQRPGLRSIGRLDIAGVLWARAL